MTPVTDVRLKALMDKKRDSDMYEVSEMATELLRLRELVKRLENAWMIDETIQTDGSLRPSISDTITRYEKLVKRLVEDANYWYESTDKYLISNVTSVIEIAKQHAALIAEIEEVENG